MVCPQCQNQENTGSQFCTRCGYDLKVDSHSGSQDTSSQQEPVSPQPEADSEASQDVGPQQGSLSSQPDAWSDSASQGFGYQQDFLALQPQPGAGSATGSLICGIIGLISTTVLCCCLITVPAGLILGIVAVVQAGRAKKLGYSGGKATGGMVLGILAIAISVLMIAYIVVSIIAYPDFIQEFQDIMDQAYERSSIDN